eukprot:TRINITY_DN43190_c0_g1_i1.p1 TRINITY_DN43190_c0_g1~~TRINITY_DN43190_c0_g1_i1.p1  ORF type:complete len:1995 (+),score=668.52 TRINITY_DN43190_c0_g1_i1:104-6088(+)
MTFGRIGVSIVRAEDLTAKEVDDSTFVRFSVVHGQRKDSADPKETKRVDAKGAAPWNSSEEWFELPEPLGPETVLMVDVQEYHRIRPNSRVGKGSASLYPQRPEGDEVRVDLDKGGVIIAKVRYDQIAAAGGGEAGTPSSGTAGPTLRQETGGGGSVVSGAVAPVALKDLPVTTQGEKVTLRVVPRAARALRPPEDSADSDGEAAAGPGAYRFVRARIRCGDCVATQHSQPAAPPRRAGDFEWDEDLVLVLQSPGGSALWDQMVDLSVNACDAHGHNPVPIGNISMPLRQVYGQKHNSLFYQWLGLEGDGDGGCTGFLKVDIGMSIGGGLPPEPQGEEYSEHEQAKRCLYAPNAHRETVMVSLDLYRAEDIPEMDSKSLGKKLSALFRSVEDDPKVAMHERAADGSGACDPFAVFRVGGAEARTAVVENSVAPVWNSRLTCPMPVPTLSTHLEVTLYDHDDLGPNDHIASLRVPVELLTTSRRTRPVAFEDVSPGMEVMLLPEPPSPAAAACVPYWARVISVDETGAVVRWQDAEKGGPPLHVDGSEVPREARVSLEWWERGPAGGWDTSFGGTPAEDDKLPPAPRQLRVVRHLPKCPPRWVNLYGRVVEKEMESSSTTLAKDSQKNSFRGRVLCGVSSRKPRSRAEAKQPSCKPIASGGQMSLSALAGVILRQYDANMDGHLDRDEFCTFYENLYKSLGQEQPEPGAEVYDLLAQKMPEIEVQRGPNAAQIERFFRLLPKSAYKMVAEASSLSLRNQEIKFECVKHKLEVYVLQGFGMKKGDWRVAVAMGRDTVRTDLKDCAADDGSIVWNHSLVYQSFWEQEYLPDVVVHLVDEDCAPVAFHRLSSQSLMALGGWWNSSLPMHEIGDPAQTQGRVLGWVNVAVRLTRWAGQSDEKQPYVVPQSPRGHKQGQVNSRGDIKPEAGAVSRREASQLQSTEQQMRIHIFQGRGLPPADDNGRADPYIKVHFPRSAGSGAAETHAVPESLNPRFNTTLTVNYRRPVISLESLGGPAAADLLPFIVVEAWDRDKVEKDTLLGRAVLRHPQMHAGTPGDDSCAEDDVPEWWQRLFGQPRGDGLATVTDIPLAPAGEASRTDRLDWVTLRGPNGEPAGELLVCFDGLPGDDFSGFGGCEGGKFVPEKGPRERRETKVAALDFSSSRVEVTAVPRPLHPKLRKYDVGICVVGLRRMRSTGLFGLRKPSVQFRVLDDTVRVVPGGAGRMDLSGWVSDRKQKAARGRVPPVWILDLPEESRHVPKLVVELLDKRLFGNETLVADAVVPLRDLHRMLTVGPRATFPPEPSCPPQLLQHVGQASTDSGRVRYKDKKAVDKRGMTPWFADYFDHVIKGGRVPANRQIQKLPCPLEDWVGGCGFRDRFVELPLHTPGQGAGGPELGAVKLRVEVQESQQAEAAAAPADDQCAPVCDTELVARVYVVRCSNLVSKDGIPPGKNDPYLELEIGNGDKASYRVSDKDGKKANTCDPEFWKCFDLPVHLPNDWRLRITVVDWDRIGSDDVIGHTTINLEDRWYSKWRTAVPWHTEQRPLYKPSSTSWSTAGESQGTIEMWVDLFPKNKSVPKPLLIAPPPPEDYELRAVVWNVSGCEMADKSVFGEYMTDIYVKGYLKGEGNGRSGEQDTDTHYRSLNGEGNFNWRMKWDMTYIRHERQIVMKEDGVLSALSRALFESEGTDGVDPELVVELWDNDLLPFSDDYMGRAVLPLTALPRSLSSEEVAKLPSTGVSDRLRSLARKLESKPSGVAPGEEGGDTLDIFALDPATARPKYLMQETPKMWFGVYRSADKKDFRNFDKDKEQEKVEKQVKKKDKPKAAPAAAPVAAPATLEVGTMESMDTMPLMKEDGAGFEDEEGGPLLDEGGAGEDTPLLSAPHDARTSAAAGSGRRALVGLVQLSFSLCKSEQADTKENAAGAGRAEPNQNPKLPEPERPDSSFSPLLSPFKSLYYILWKNLWKYALCIFCLAVVLFALFLTFQCAIKKALGSDNC